MIYSSIWSSPKTPVKLPNTLKTLKTTENLRRSVERCLRKNRSELGALIQTLLECWCSSDLIWQSMLALTATVTSGCKCLDGTVAVIFIPESEKLTWSLFWNRICVFHFSRWWIAQYGSKIRKLKIQLVCPSTISNNNWLLATHQRCLSQSFPGT